MSTRLRWKVIVTLAVVVGISMFAWYPLLAERYGLKHPDFIIQKRLRLGLDLKGGIHLVLRVNTDEALQAETQATAERMREALERRGVTPRAIETINATQFRVAGVLPEQHGIVRQVADDVSLDFVRETGIGGTDTFTMKPNIIVTRRQETVTQAQRTIERRVNDLGVAEPMVAVQGAAGDQILVQLPDVTEPSRATEIIRSTARLEWKLVEQGPARSRQELLRTTSGHVLPDMEVITGAVDPATGAETAYYLVRKPASVTGGDLRSARATLDENNQPVVGFSLTKDGARRFSKLTGENVGRALAIILDGRVQSAPQIEERIGGEGHIRGSFTQQEAADLALLLRSGSLKASMTFLGGHLVGPSLGADSLRSGILASLAGLGLIAVFLVVYYKGAGINAVLSVLINLLVLVGFMAYLGATLTLPGMAGLILTIGMGVDSNVLIFERIKEELANSKGVKVAVAAGFDRVLLTILDTHIASLIAAAFLFQFGTGPIRGFATTLTFGLLSNVFTAVFVSRTLFELILSRRQVTQLSI